MAQTINTNISTLTAQRNANRVQNDLSTAIGRLSSGLRINSAKDDAAGLAISERFTTQIRGLTVAARNSNDAISLAQTAEGALSSVSGNLQRVRELAVQSANASNSATDRAALQAEASALVAEIQRVGSQTEFNGIKLLDGSFASQAFQVGANSGQTITVASITDARSSSLGSHSLGSAGTVVGTVTGGSSTVNGVAVETDLTLTTSAGSTSAISYAVSSGADAIATAINTAASGIGINAVASNSTTISSLSAAGTVSFVLNGQNVSAAVADQNDLSNLVSAINGVAATTGVTATFTSSASKGSITLGTTDGRNIGLGTFANSTAGNQTASFGGTTLTEGGTVAAIKTGTVALTSTKGPIATAGANTDVFAAAVSNSSFAAVAALDLSSVSGATAALSTIDAALQQINSGRADLGAVQNRFASTISNIENATENLSASRSRILDADFAHETAAMSRAQVLQQAATAMIAQANQMPQQVLQLLR